MAIEFDESKLAWRLTADVDEFRELGETHDTADGNFFTFIKSSTKSHVLAVAHLDTVRDPFSYLVLRTPGGTLIRCGTLDDRLGVHVILDLLPQLGVNCDVLLTTGEEKGQSTAQMFETTKKYNWIFSFDRHGTGVVMYQYETKDLRNKLDEFGWRTEQGSYSDIADLAHLGVAGFNFGVGYHDEHHDDSHCRWEVVVKQAERFVPFWQKYRNKRIESTAKDRGRNKVTTGYTGRYGNYGESAYHYDDEYWRKRDEAYLNRHNQPVNTFPPTARVVTSATVTTTVEKSHTLPLTRREKEEADAIARLAQNEPYHDRFDDTLSAEEQAKIVLDDPKVSNEPILTLSGRTKWKFPPQDRPNLDMIRCPVCRLWDDSTNYSNRYGMCGECLNDLRTAAQIEIRKDEEAMLLNNKNI